MSGPSPSAPASGDLQQSGPVSNALPALQRKNDVRAVVEVPDRPQPLPSESTPFLQEPVLWAALIAFVGTLIALRMNNRFHRERLIFEERLAEKKHDYDLKLENRKFNHIVKISHWEQQSEFAQAHLATFYEAKARLHAIRSPASYSSENDNRPGRADERDTVRNARDSYYPVLRRVSQASEFFNEFYAARYRAVALFGAEAEEPFKLIWRAVNRVQSSASMLLQEQMHRDHPNVTSTRQRMENQIWEGAADEDTIAADVETAVEQAEAIFRPVILSGPEPAQLT